MGLVLEFWGRGAGGDSGWVGHRGLRRGVRDSLQPARFPALPEGAGAVVAGTRVAFGRPGEIWVLQEAIPGPNSKRPSTTDEIWVPQEAIPSPNLKRPIIISNPRRFAEELHNLPIQQR